MKIIKKGYKTKPQDIVYIKKCHTCGCVFTYTINDLKLSLDSTYLACPDCGYDCNIFFQRKYKGEK